MTALRQLGVFVPRLLLLCMIVYVMSNMGRFTQPVQQGEVFYQTYEPLGEKGGGGPVVSAGDGGLLGKQDVGGGAGEQDKASSKGKQKKLRKGKRKKRRREEEEEAEEKGERSSAGAAAGTSASVSKDVAPSEEDGKAPDQGTKKEAVGEAVAKEYASECRWSFTRDEGGYPLVAFDGELGDFVCPSMFRDLSDYVFGWPFSHFGENVFVLDRGSMRSNLPPVPIIYSHVDHLRKGELAPWLRSVVNQPYILITGQSDWAIPSSTGNSEQVLADPNLVRWFAQNNDVSRPKLSPVPIGLNCFEHAPEMAEARRLIGPSPVKTDLLLVNFGNSHPDRDKVWKYFCSPSDPSKQFATCLTKTQPNNVKGNPHLVPFYQDMSTFQYVLCPRGNGLDTHRVWEALYLGATPVVLRSALDPLYEGLPLLWVERFEDVTADMLRSEYPRLRREREEWDGRQLTRRYWWELVEGVRAEALVERNLTDVSPRRRCWGKARRRQ